MVTNYPFRRKRISLPVQILSSQRFVYVSDIRLKFNLKQASLADALGGGGRRKGFVHFFGVFFPDKSWPAPVTRNPRSAKVHHGYMSCKLPQINPRSFYVPLNYNVTATVNAKETPLPEGSFFLIQNITW